MVALVVELLKDTFELLKDAFELIMRNDDVAGE